LFRKLYIKPLKRLSMIAKMMNGNYHG
jgi:hypothetical protein